MQICGGVAVDSARGSLSGMGQFHTVRGLLRELQAPYAVRTPSPHIRTYHDSLRTAQLR